MTWSSFSATYLQSIKPWRHSSPGHTEIASAFAIVFAFPKTGRIACAMHQFTALGVATIIELTGCNNESRTRRGRDAISRRARCGQSVRLNKFLFTSAYLAFLGQQAKGEKRHEHFFCVQIFWYKELSVSSFRRKRPEHLALVNKCFARKLFPFSDLPVNWSEKWLLI